MQWNILRLFQQSNRYQNKISFICEKTCCNMKIYMLLYKGRLAIVDNVIQLLQES